MTVKELFKAMEEGKVGTAQILKAAAAMDKMAEKNGALSEALKTSQAAQVRFENKMKNFALVYVRIIDPVLTAMFNALGAISDILLMLAPAIKVVVDVFMRLVDNLRTFIDVLKGIAENVDWLKTTLLALGIISALTLGGMLAGSTAAAGGFVLLAKAVGAVKAGLLLIQKAAPVMMFLALIELTRQLHDYYVTGGTGSSWIEVLASSFQLGFAKIGLQVQMFRYYMAMLEYHAKRTFNELTGIRWSDAFGFLNSDTMKWLEKMADPRTTLMTAATTGMTMYGKLTVDVNQKDAQGNVTTTRQEIPVEFTQGANAVGGQ